MKKGTIIALVVAIVLIVVGGILVVMGLSFAGGGTQESILTEQTITATEPFDSIKINTQDCDVKFVPYNGDVNAQITILEQDRVSHQVLVEDGTLTIKMTDQRKWTDHIRVFNVYGQTESMSMTLCIPNTLYESVYITTDTGDIRIPGVLQAEEMTLRSDTGDVWLEGGPVQVLDCMLSTGGITVRGGEAEIMTLRTGTGKLDVTDVIAEELHLGIDTGKTEVENVIAPIFTVNGGSGDMEVENVQAEEYLQVFTDTGDIDITNSESLNVNIATDTGDITVPKAWEFQRIETDTGKVKFQ